MCVKLLLRNLVESAPTKIPEEHTQDLVESGCQWALFAMWDVYIGWDVCENVYNNDSCLEVFDQNADSMFFFFFANKHINCKHKELAGLKFTKFADVLMTWCHIIQTLHRCLCCTAVCLQLLSLVYE